MNKKKRYLLKGFVPLEFALIVALPDQHSMPSDALFAPSALYYYFCNFDIVMLFLLCHLDATNLFEVVRFDNKTKLTLSAATPVRANIFTFFNIVKTHSLRCCCCECG